MDPMDEIRQRLKISNLEAKIALIEIETARHAREISSPLTSAERRDEVVANRDDALSKVLSLRQELEALRMRFPTLAAH